MLIIEIKGEKLVIPEPKDIPFLEETKKNILENKGKTYQYLKRAYLKFRNIDNLPLQEKEKRLITEILKNNSSIDNQIRYVCAYGTIQGALISEVATNKNIFDNLNNGIAFYRS